MSLEKYFSALDRARDHWNGGNLNGYLQLYGPKIVLHGPGNAEPGLAGAKKFYEAFWSGFPASNLIFEDVFGAADKVVCRFRIEGTHSGRFQGLAPTGKRINFPGITILRFSGEKCVERWTQSDSLGLLAQLGALPGG